MRSSVQAVVRVEERGRGKMSASGRIGDEWRMRGGRQWVNGCGNSVVGGCNGSGGGDRQGVQLRMGLIESVRRGQESPLNAWAKSCFLVEQPTGG
jgi:hypothetical protein